MVNIRYTLDDGAKNPTRAHISDTGWDVYAREYGEADRKAFLDSLKPKDGDGVQGMVKIVLDTGLHIQPPKGYYFELYPNSRLSKTSFMYANSVGIIDESYTGSVKVVLNYIPNRQVDSDVAFLEGVLRQERPIGQLVLRKRVRCVWDKVESLEETLRGSGGFGSSERKKGSSEHKEIADGNLPVGITKFSRKVSGNTYTYYVIRAAKNQALFRICINAFNEEILEAAKTLNSYVREEIANICDAYGRKGERSRAELTEFCSKLYKEVKRIGVVEFCNNLKTEESHE